MASMKEIGAAWEKQGKNGKYLNAKVKQAIPAGGFVMLFSNTNPKGPKSPAYFIKVQVSEVAK